MGPAGITAGTGGDDLPGDPVQLRKQLETMVRLCRNLQSQITEVTQSAGERHLVLSQRVGELTAQVEHLQEERESLKTEVAALKGAAAPTTGRPQHEAGPSDINCPEQHVEAGTAHSASSSNSNSSSRASSRRSSSSSEALVSLGTAGRRLSERVIQGHGAAGSRSATTVEVLSGQAHNDWVEELVRHPAPPYGLDNAVIKLILQQWSADLEKQLYLGYWLSCAACDKSFPPGFPPGLQLVSLAPEIKDAFLTLVVPILRKRAGLRLLVYTRMCRGAAVGLWDLRLRIASLGGARGGGAGSRGGSSSSASSGGAHQQRQQQEQQRGRWRSKSSGQAAWPAMP